EVTFDIDANGIINVSAKDKGTGKEQKITIASSNKLSKEEIDAMVKQAEQFADADKRKMELVEAHNQAETTVYTVRKTLDELGEKVTQQERAAIEAAVSDLEAANKGDSVDDIKSKIDALMKAMEPVSQRIYAEASKEQPKGPEGPSGGSAGGQSSQESAKGDYVDADYKIVDD
ncbi:MAG: Hsp70 family protein, partial [Candidatus Methanomethylophilaceae archaeon]|nr:Hsp70 family protein [Candidatus Methanomethylophilaceae archaeon]